MSKDHKVVPKCASDKELVPFAPDEALSSPDVPWTCPPCWQSHRRRGGDSARLGAFFLPWVRAPETLWSGWNLLAPCVHQILLAFGIYREEPWMCDTSSTMVVADQTLVARAVVSQFAIKSELDGNFFLLFEVAPTNFFSLCLSMAEA